MRVIFINAVEQTVEERNINTKGLSDFYKTIGCSTVQMGVSKFRRTTLWLDEEGLLKGAPYLFRIEGGGQLYAGNAIITGGQGGVDCKLTVQEVQNAVQFYGQREVSFG
jgi:hypothetical protein